MRFARVNFLSVGKVFFNYDKYDLLNQSSVKGGWDGVTLFHLIYGPGVCAVCKFKFKIFFQQKPTTIIKKINNNNSQQQPTKIALCLRCTALNATNETRIV